MYVTPAAPAVARNGGLSMPLMSSSSSSQPSRMEWRAVGEQSVRNSGNEELERSRLGQSDERLIYEVKHGGEPVDVGFSSVTIDGTLDNDILQQRLPTVAKRREEMQKMEIELRAQIIARSQIVGMQSTFDSKIKELADANVELQEQLHEKEQKVHELERKMEEKERELHAIRLDHEAAWAKEDLLREQSKELQSYRRERDNSEAERMQHIKQIHELQEHIQEKDRQFIELQEQQRVAQETIVFKEEQLREAQAWMTRAQEMDALQSTTNHTLQAELRDRTEHCGQLWLACQTQSGEMERLHLHIQQLQLELADAREKTGSKLDGLHVSGTNFNDASELGQINDNQLQVHGNGSPRANSGSSHNGNSKSASGGNTPAEADHVHGVAFAPSSLIGMPTYVPTGQMTALHPFVMHQQAVPQSPQIMQSLHSVSAMPPIHTWQNQQAQPDGKNLSSQNQYPQATEQNLLRTVANYNYNASGNGQILLANYVDANISQGLKTDSVVPSVNGERQVFDSIPETYGNTQSPPSLQQISSEFHHALKLNPVPHGCSTKEKQIDHLVSHDGTENRTTPLQHANPVTDAYSSEALANAKSYSETSTDTASNADLSDAFVPDGQKTNTVGKVGEIYILDERALLASIARTIGSGGRIRISSTLPNRLGRMLAPLNWHDYQKKFGKLDDFVASHPELFFIEGDHVQLREGAQEIIAATATVAKVAAAAAAADASLYSTLLPSVALTPMARSHQPRKASSLNGVYYSSQLSGAPHQNVSSGSFHVAGGSSVKILSKPKDHHVDLNGSENRIGRSEKIHFSHSKSSSFGKPDSSVGKQHSRGIGTASNLRR